MGKTLRRYVLAEVLTVLLLGLLLTTFVLAVVEMVDLVDLVFAKGVPAKRVLSVFGYLLPSYVELTLPMALLLSIVAAFARLSRDCEVLALRAAGMSLGQLVRPMISLGAAVALVSFTLAAWTGPWANRNLERAVTDMAKTRITAALSPGVFSQWIDDIVIYVGAIERRSGNITHVMLADERDEDRPRTIFALRGRLTTDDEAGLALFRMREGTILADYADPLSYDKTDFQEFELNINLGEEAVPTGSTFMEEPRRLGWDALLAARDALRAQGRPTTDQDIEIQRRMAVPFACFLLPLVGVPLGVQRSRSTRSRGVVVSLAVILVYYFLVTAGVTAVHEGLVPAAPALWAPNFVLLAAGLVIYLKGGGSGRLPRMRARRRAAQQEGRP